MVSQNDGFFLDEERDLKWRKVPVVPGISLSVSGGLFDMLRPLDEWTILDKNIKQYISNVPLGKYLSMLSDLRNEDFTCPTFAIFLAYKDMKSLFRKKENVLVGVLAVDTYNPGVAHIQYMAVNPKYREQGIGSSMVESVISEIGFFTPYSYGGKIFATADKSNKPIVGLLKKYFNECDLPTTKEAMAENYLRFVANPQSVNKNEDCKEERENE
ncbi:MAG: GNAT family N-acetyltransferase [Clostridia bacterium]|nr:GNAT family N-acetyltransferase [Clostridia bacterium]